MTSYMLNAPAVSLGPDHGYAFNGEQVHLHAAIRQQAAAAGLSLQLWACATPYTGGSLHGTKVAEVNVDAGAANDALLLDQTVNARLPAGHGEHVMVLVLAAANECGTTVVDFANYPRPETFPLPQLRGQSDYRIDGDSVTLTVECVENPRDELNLSGSLDLELWALDAPYSDDAFNGWLLGRAALGTLNGQSMLQNLAIQVPFTPAPAGEWHIALLLREWTADGYRTRDFANFALTARWDAEPTAEPAAVLTPEQPVSEVAAVAVAEATAPVAVEIAAPVAPAPVVIVAEQEVPAPTKGKSKAKAAASIVSVNTATAAELAAVKGLSKALAAAIVAARPFTQLEDLLKVKGMGQKTLERLRASLTL
ncbi:ComEA family DNA-binding protein [Plasticicumulans acidivorans]|uniref:Competence ComEA-like helix-hairpin-helix protein n=1 Tax=Plasticicumulans acidivorans TaxID=886464 RepID=A0A317N4X0_9GAMM|nr:helix-hairpin-helix domain-containing protein [Plasticicumulans acidivorans]PWV65799.1 competence ComEA-like helix-hairpin-helix protein [Plasticicumulans acidivorans]